MEKRIELTSEKVEKIIYQICRFTFGMDSFCIMRPDIQIEQLTRECENVLRILEGDDFNEENIGFILECVTEIVNDYNDQYKDW